MDAFDELRRSGIQSDSSISLLIPFIHSLFQSQTTNSISLARIVISIVLMILCFWFPIQPPTRQHLSHHPNQSIHSSPILKELITHQQSIQFHSPHRNTSIVYSPQNTTLEFYSHHPHNSSFNRFTSNETTLSHLYSHNSISHSSQSSLHAHAPIRCELPTSPSIPTPVFPILQQ